MKPNNQVHLQIRINGKPRNENARKPNPDDVRRKKSFDDYFYQKEVGEILNDEIWNK